MPNTGYVGCLLLEQYYLDTNLPTGVVVSNDPSHPSYIPPTYNPRLCPVSTLLPTPTPTPTLTPTPIPLSIPMLGGLRMNNASGPQVVNLTYSDDFRFTNFATDFSLFVEFTTKSVTIPTDMVIISALTTNILANSGWWVWLDGTDLNFSITPLGVTLTAGFPIYSNDIQNIRMNLGITYSATTDLLSLYHNGVFINQVVVNSSTLVVPTSGDVQLGGDTVNAGSIGYTLFDGILWNAFFYNTTLSAPEMLTLNNGGEVGSPFAQYYFNEDENAIAADNSGNLLVGNIVGYTVPELSFGATNNWVNENETPKV